MPELLTIPQRKEIRSALIGRHVVAGGYRGAVIFSSGNAARALRSWVGMNGNIYVVEVSPAGPLQPGKWWTPEEIHRAWPDLFDATPGHLPLPLMAQLARALAAQQGDLGQGPYLVPTGSGETILALRWAYPRTEFVAAYECGQGTEYDEEAPLNQLVAAGGRVTRQTAAQTSAAAGGPCASLP